MRAAEVWYATGAVPWGWSLCQLDPVLIICSTDRPLSLLQGHQTGKDNQQDAFCLSSETRGNCGSLRGICMPVAVLEGRHPGKPSRQQPGSNPCLVPSATVPWGTLLVPSALQYCGLTSPAWASCLPCKQDPCELSSTFLGYCHQTVPEAARQSVVPAISHKTAVWSRNPDTQPPVLTCLPFSTPG